MSGAIINGGNPIRVGQTLVPVSATGYTAAASMYLVYGSITQAQAFTVVDSTHFNITAIVQGNVPFGAITFRITEGATTENISVTLNPVEGNAYTVVASPDTTIDSIFYQYAAYASIIQIEYNNADRTIISPNGFFQVFGIIHPLQTLQTRFWDGSVWVTNGEIIINPATVQALNNGLTLSEITTGNLLKTCHFWGDRSLPDGQILLPPTTITWPAVDSIQTIGGQQVKFTNGKKYSYPGLVFQGDVYFPTWVSTFYTEDILSKYIYDQFTNKTYPVADSISESWQYVDNIQQILGINNKWHSLTLLSPSAPDLSSYTSLSNSIANQESTFMDDSIIFESVGGKKVGTFTAVKTTVACPTTICTINHDHIFVSKGQTYTFEASVYVKQGLPQGLFSLTTSYVINSPGIKVLLNSSLQPSVQFTWGDAPTWTQGGTPKALTYNKWYKLKLVVNLDDVAGQVSLYLGGQLIIYAAAQTLPLPDAIVDKLQLGVLSNTSSTSDAIVSISDINFSHT